MRQPTIRTALSGLILFLVAWLPAGCEQQAMTWRLEQAEGIYGQGFRFPDNFRIAHDIAVDELMANPDSGCLDALYYLLGRCKEHLGQSPMDDYTALLREFPDSPFAGLARRRLPLLMNVPQDQVSMLLAMPAPDLRDEDRAFFDAWYRYDTLVAGDSPSAMAALAACDSFTAAYPASALVPDVLACRARIFHAMPDGEAALAAYREIIGRFPGSRRAIQAELQIGTVQMQLLQEPAAARERFLEFMAKYPDHPDYGWAVMYLGMAEERLGNRAAAVAVYAAATELDDKFRLWNGAVAQEFAEQELARIRATRALPVPSR